MPIIPPWMLRQPSVMMDDPSQGGITGNMPFPSQAPPVFPGFDAPPNPTPFDGSGNPYAQDALPQPDFNQMRMQQLFNPEHMAQDRVNQLLNQIPQHENPSFMRRLSAAMVAGGGNYGESQHILNEPYERKYSEWKDQFGPAVQSANLERYSNATERQAAQNQLQYDSQTKRIEETERHDKATEEDRANRTEIARSRANAYNWKQNHPNHVIKLDKDGYMIGIDPQSNQSSYILDANGDPVKGDKLPQKELIDLNQKNAIARIDETGSQQRKTEETREKNRETLDAVKTGNDILVKTVPGIPRSGSSSSNKPVSEFQIKQGRINRAVELQNERPDLAPFIHVENGEVHIDNPSVGFFGNRKGPADNDYSMMQDRILGIKPSASHSTNSNGSINSNGEPTSAPPTTPNGPTIQQPPPPDQRTDGMPWTFPNGNKGKWDAKAGHWVVTKKAGS